jgi:hypothetical protein
MFSKSLAFAPRLTIWLRTSALGLALVAGIGCREEQGITQYTVPQASEYSEPQYAWYIKLSGPPEAVEQLASRFQEFVQSIDVGENADGSPVWDLPDTWTSEPATDGVNYLRITTGESDASLTVSVMALRGGQVNSLHANYNRWRGQVKLPEVEGVNWLVDAAAAGEHQVITGVEGDIHLFDFRSKPDADEPQRMLAAVVYQETGPVPEIEQAVATDDLPSGHPPIGAMSNDNLPAEADPADLPEIPWTYETPDSWVTRTPNVSFDQLRLWTVTVDGETVRISVATSGGSLNDNLMRWGALQAGLPLTTEDELAGYTEEVLVGGIPSVRAMFEGVEESVGGVIVPMSDGSGFSWFFKINGPPAAVEKVRAEFDAFIASLESVE